MGDVQLALAQLCQLYWMPLYAFIRRCGHSAPQAEDLTQDFFVRLLEKDVLAEVEQSRGRFRAFLLTACRNFLANAHDRAVAQKRGGGQTLLSLDFEHAEGRYSREIASETMSPEKLFERRWALALLEAVLQRLAEEYRLANKHALFDSLKGCLTGSLEDDYITLGNRLNLSEGAVKVAVHRLRKRYRELLREQIAETVESPEQVEQEIRDLFRALAM
jgi:RNA polymerase sigma-70 factor (ECF subfamily)